MSPAVIAASAGTTTTSTAGGSRGCIITGTARPPVVTVRPVPVTSTRIAGIEGPTAGALGLRRREDADERGQR